MYSSGSTTYSVMSYSLSLYALLFICLENKTQTVLRSLNCSGPRILLVMDGIDEVKLRDVFKHTGAEEWDERVKLVLTCRV